MQSHPRANQRHLETPEQNRGRGVMRITPTDSSESCRLHIAPVFLYFCAGGVLSTDFTTERLWLRMVKAL